MLHLKTFDVLNEKLVDNYSKDILQNVKFKGTSLQDWAEYSNDNPNALPHSNMSKKMVFTFATPTAQLERVINAIVNKYAATDDEEERTFVKNEKQLKTDMFDLARLLIDFTGSVERGTLEAFCMQNMDSEEWSKSSKLVKTNATMGVFEKKK